MYFCIENNVFLVKDRERERDFKILQFYNYINVIMYMTPVSIKHNLTAINRFVALHFLHFSHLERNEISYLDSERNKSKGLSVKNANNVTRQI